MRFFGVRKSIAVVSICAVAGVALAAFYFHKSRKNEQEVTVLYSYPGFSAEQMKGLIVSASDRALSSGVEGVSKVEWDSMPSYGYVRLHFQPDINIGPSLMRLSSVSSSIIHSIKPGSGVHFDASNVPHLEPYYLIQVGDDRK